MCTNAVFSSDDSPSTELLFSFGFFYPLWDWLDCLSQNPSSRSMRVQPLVHWDSAGIPFWCCCSFALYYNHERQLMFLKTASLDLELSQLLCLAYWLLQILKVYLNVMVCIITVMCTVLTVQPQFLLFICLSVWTSECYLEWVCNSKTILKTMSVFSLCHVWFLFLFIASDILFLVSSDDYNKTPYKKNSVLKEVFWLSSTLQYSKQLCNQK